MLRQKRQIPIDIIVFIPHPTGPKHPTARSVDGESLSGQLDLELIKFDATKNVPGNAVFAVTLAGLAYKSPSEIEKELVKHSGEAKAYLFFQTPLTAGFITEWDDVVAVAFRGSSTWREWLNNANIFMKRTPYGRIHTGFYNTIDEIAPILLKFVGPRLLSGSKIVVTGHSRGGALAILFALSLRSHGFTPQAIYMFGSPRVGDAEFVNNFCSEADKIPIEQSRVPSFISIPASLMLIIIMLIPTAIFLLCLFAKSRLKAFAQRYSSKSTHDTP
jgi:hypothetical protein